MFLFKELPKWRGKIVMLLHDEKRSEKITSLWAKVGIMLMSDNPTWREKFDKGLILHVGRKV
jgi:hypothetical protein